MPRRPYLWWLNWRHPVHGPPAPPLSLADWDRVLREEFLPGIRDAMNAPNPIFRDAEDI